MDEQLWTTVDRYFGRLDATAIQTVGEKGYDGFAFARVVEPT